MELIHIVPVKNLSFYRLYGLASSPTTVMCLTHLVEEFPQYAEFFKDYEGYKILDNSLIELEGAVDIERVVAAAEAIGAQEIILPDAFRSYTDTRNSVESSLDWLSKRDMLERYNIMAVCQGYDLDLFNVCFKWMESIKEINVIGIPKVCAKMHQAGRPYFEYLWKNSPVTVHLLGLWYSWEELSRFDCSRIRSVDSCQMAFQSAHNLPREAVRPDGFTLDLKHSCLNTSDLLERAKVLHNLIER